MKKKKCPYCGRRASYTASFVSRRKAEYICPRCGKESRVVINKTVIVAFIICALISLVVLALWVYLKMTSNPLGIAAVALPLIIFLFISPKFVSFEPFKKYKKEMEAKKAGIAYSDNLTVTELDDESSAGSLEASGKFKINSELFNQIKAERTVAREQLEQSEIVSNSAELKKPYVHVIDDVRENHAVDEVPLKKLHSEGTKINRTKHYIEPSKPDIEDDSDVKEYKRPRGNRYSANRRF